MCILFFFNFVNNFFKNGICNNGLLLLIVILLFDVLKYGLYGNILFIILLIVIFFDGLLIF